MFEKKQKKKNMGETLKDSIAYYSKELSYNCHVVNSPMFQSIYLVKNKSVSLQPEPSLSFMNLIKMKIFVKKYSKELPCFE